MPIRTIWSENGVVYLLDQTLLPGQKTILQISTAEEMWEAIKRLRVRGAPAIGVAAAYGVYLASKQAGVGSSQEERKKAALKACEYLATSRPTAVNLFWALDRARNAIAGSTRADLPAELLQLAETIRQEDDEACRAIGRHGATLLKNGDTVLTHCNAGGLATASYGTALAPIYFAMEEGKRIAVFADETRPLLQGSRLTAWELQEAGVPVTVICDSMAPSVMRAGGISAVIVGADRIAANGDFANKIGTYMVALAAREHKVPFYVAAPLSTVDLAAPNGDAIPIEQRAADEITAIQGVAIAPGGVNVFNPAFDVTPNEFVNAFITEKGVVRAPFELGLREQKESTQ